MPAGADPAGEHALVIGAHGRAEPAGIAGELWLRGSGLARGYLHDAARTDDAFAPDPDRAGARCFRTGSSARIAHDGRVVVLGRADRVVEVAGRPVRLDAVERARRPPDGARGDRGGAQRRTDLSSPSSSSRTSWPSRA